MIQEYVTCPHVHIVSILFRAEISQASPNFRAQFTKFIVYIVFKSCVVLWWTRSIIKSHRHATGLCAKALYIPALCSQSHRRVTTKHISLKLSTLRSPQSKSITQFNAIYRKRTTEDRWLAETSYCHGLNIQTNSSNFTK